MKRLLFLILLCLLVTKGQSQILVDICQFYENGDSIIIDYRLDQFEKGRDYYVNFKAFIGPDRIGFNKNHVHGDRLKINNNGSDRRIAWEIMKDFGHRYDDLKAYLQIELYADLYIYPDSLINGMVFVKGGTFTMGCNPQQGKCREVELPAHEVLVDDFYIDQYEVTNEQYCVFLNETINEQNSNSKLSESPYSRSKIKKLNDHYQIIKGFESHPVTCINWYGANAYVQWRSKKEGLPYRLPTEAEWEYAARGGQRTRNHIYAGSNNIIDVGGRSKDTRPVGSLKPNELGIYDLTGNVYEFCSNWFEPNYKKRDFNNPVGPKEGKEKVMRGGGWGNNGFYSRLTWRYQVSPSQRNCDYGFRCVRSK